MFKFMEKLTGNFKKYSDTPTTQSELIEKNNERDLYKTRFGDLFWLNKDSYIDEEIIKNGVWEPMTDLAIKKLIKAGDVILEVGANIGDHTVVMSKIIGNEGKIYSFEPTEYYSKVLRQNIEANKLTNCNVQQIGLSNKKQSLTINIGKSSATLHSPDGKASSKTELISLDTLDSWIIGKSISKINFILLDIDGHEPLFLEGAWKTIEKFDPIILLEVNHLNYLEAGYNAWDFYENLVSRGYHIYTEDTFEEIKSRSEFLKKCGNFAYSANIIISKKPIKVK